MNIAALRLKAQAAKPEKPTARPRVWAQLWPVYADLRANGHSGSEAVKWLVKEGAIPAGREERAVNAFHVLATRRNKKASRS